MLSDLAMNKCTGRPLPQKAVALQESTGSTMQGGISKHTDLAPASIALHHVAPDDGIPQTH